MYACMILAWLPGVRTLPAAGSARSLRPDARPWLRLAAVLGILCLAAPPAQALNYYWGVHPDKERLVIEFDGPVPVYGVDRAGRQALFVDLPPERLTANRPPSRDIGGTRLLSRVRVTDSGLSVELRDPAFGYITFPLPESRKIVIDVFPDPIGAKWRPSGAAPNPPAATPQPEPPPTVRPDEVPPPEAVQRTTNPDAAFLDPELRVQNLFEEPAQGEKPDTVSGQVANETADRAVAEPEGEGPTRPFYSVPYTFRSGVNSGGPDDWRPPQAMQPAPQQVRQNTTRPQQETGPASEPQPPEEVRRAMPGAGGQLAPPPAPGQAAPEGVIARQPSSSPKPVPQAVPQAVPQTVDLDNGETPPAFRGRVLPPEEAPAPQRTIAEAVPQGAPGVVRQSISRQGPPSQTDGQVSEDGQAQANAQAKDTGARQTMTTPKEPGAQPAADGQIALPESFFNNETSQQAAQGDRPEQPEQAEQAEEEDLAALFEGQQSLVTEEDNATPPDLAALADQAQQSLDEEAAAEGDQGPDFEGVLYQARVAQNNGDYPQALELYQGLKKKKALPADMREEVLYAIGDILYTMNRDNLKGAYADITDAYQEAMNYNLESERTPSALLRMGIVNMRVDNIREAEAYFNILRDKHPYDENVPLIFYYWGEYFFERENYQKAADQFQKVVQDYPDSKFVREASTGLARSLFKLGYDDQAFRIADFIEKRFPRFYIEFPPFMKLVGDIAYRTGRLDKAKENYWTYYNIDPEGDEADLVLARLGDIYVNRNKTDAAAEVYTKAATTFPDRDGGLIAQMRLAEEGIYDEPSVADMFEVFDRPFNLRPVEIYDRILTERPDSELAPLAQLKKAMWTLFNNKHRDAIRAAGAFEQKYPANALAQRAREVGVKAFEDMVAAYVDEENYERIIEVWNEFPYLREVEDELSPRVKIGLALAHWKRDQPQKALGHLEPFFEGPEVKDYGEMALHLAVSIYLENQAWQPIVDLAEQVELWDLAQKGRQELDYALALAHENLGDTDQAMPYWTRLAGDTSLEADRRGVPVYYMAMNARADRDLETAYEYAQEALDLLLVSGEETGKIRDLLGVLMDVTEASGRSLEALKWAEEYAAYVKPGDPEYPAFRYRQAQLERNTGNTAGWRKIMEDLAENRPRSLYGRMAKSELQTYQIERTAREYEADGPSL